LKGCEFQIKFICIDQTGTLDEKWEGVIKTCEKYEGYFEIMIESRSSIMVHWEEAYRLRLLQSIEQSLLTKMFCVKNFMSFLN